MVEKKVIAVVGGLGAQGNGLVQKIIKDGEFKARILTRDPNSEKAKKAVSAFPSGSYELVAADLEHVDTLTKAFTGAHYVFCLTNYWEHMSTEKEMQHAKNQAEALKAAKVQHAIWSTLEDSRRLFKEHGGLKDSDLPVIHDGYRVPHMDAKEASNAYFEKSGVPTTFLYTSFYYENFTTMLKPQRGQDGKLALTMPLPTDAPLYGVAVEDIGKTAYYIFKRASEFAGKKVGVAGDSIPVKQYADLLGKTFGETVNYNAVPRGVYATFPFPGAADLANMFETFNLFKKPFGELRDPKNAKKLNPELQSFPEWLKVNEKTLKESWKGL